MELIITAKLKLKKDYALPKSFAKDIVKEVSEALQYAVEDIAGFDKDGVQATTGKITAKVE